MSLVLLSNDEVFNNGGGISQPNSFTNVTESPLIVKADSEVALQSLKINKEGQAHVSRANNRMGLYIGEYLDEDYDPYEEAYTRSIRNVNDITLNEGTYDQDAFANMLVPRFKKAIFHPDFQDTFNASVQKDGGDFKGYNLRFDYTTAAPSSSLPTTTQSVQAGYEDYTYNSSTGVMTATSGGNGGIAQFTDAPLSANQGRLIIDFSAAGIEWAMGLNRFADLGVELPPYGNGGEFGFYDFVAARDGSELKLYHAVHSDLDEEGEISMEEVVYYGYTGAEYTTPYDLGGNASAFNYLEFQVTNDKVEFYLSKSGAIRTLVCSPDLGTPGKENYFKPVNQVCAYLYPKIALEPTLIATIKTYEGRAPTDFSYTGKNNAGNHLSMDFYRQCLLDGNISLCSELDTRFYNDMEDTDTYTFAGISASATIDSSVVLVVGNTQLYKSPGRQVNAYNTDELLGFQNEKWLKSTTFSNTFELFTSTDVPIYKSQDSIFVRLSSGTQLSKNGLTGTDSKILYHCPRFDNAGNEQGGLYFEPGEKTYLDLGNIGDTPINSFSIDIVDRKDKLVKGLIGDSIVMLHIRQKK